LLDSDSFRAVLGRFASGVTVVTAVNPTDRRDHGMTVSAFCSVSLDPPLVLLCASTTVDMHEVLAETSHFVVNILRENQEAIARRFAGTDPDRFDGIGYTRGKSSVALLDDVLAYVECRKVAAHRAGDHTIYVGQVESAETREGRPLLYYRSGYAQLER
jgi:flavin reductase (DIM6/NTAB) family NADH-FMN oxidoreductase RutF